MDGPIEKFDGENIDGQHPRPPVLVETIEREGFDAGINSVNISPRQKFVLYLLTLLTTLIKHTGYTDV